jgi:transaldolase/glucose-6-phosphate isomerase
MVDKVLESNIQAAQQAGDDERAHINRELLGQAAIANAKLAYKRFMELFYGQAFARLREAEAQVQRPLWASTGTKNPAYPDTLYVDSLIGRDTVNTAPPATLEAFRDHGAAAETLIEELDSAEDLLDRLAEVGVNMHDVTNQLQIDGVKLFADAFDNLLRQVDGKRNVLATGVMPGQQLSLGAYEGAVHDAIRSLEKARANERIWKHDGSLWKDNPAIIAKVENRLGWLDVLKSIDRARLQAVQDEMRASDISHVVLLGMGGSSLAPEVLYQTFGKQPDFPTFLMLDSTDPARVRAIDQALDLSRSLFIVSSKSGGTIELMSFFKYFFERTGDNGKQFIAITDEGTGLDVLAQDKGFRDIFRNPADIGGRFSALSYFGLVPAALLGFDLDRIWAETERMIKANAANVPANHHPGIWLGAILGALGQQGRDKVLVHCSPSIASFGNWVEQLIAESTGKEGKGLLPVVGGNVGAPDDYADDSLLVYLRVEGDPGNAALDVSLDSLRRAGHPLVTLRLDDPFALAGEFFRWEYATAVAGKLLDINPFDEPNVTESKENTARLLKLYREQGSLPATEPALVEKNVRLYADDRLLDTLRAQPGFKGSDLTGVLAALIRANRPGDYLALLAYLPPTLETDAELEEVRRRLRDATQRAVTIGYGPRFQHSTGQLHKGGPNNGIFIQITCDDAHDLPIPGEPYSFGVLKAAQAAGDMEALRSKDRRALRLHITGDIDTGLDVLTAAINRLSRP